jgi:hypothetical protein
MILDLFISIISSFFFFYEMFISIQIWDFISDDDVRSELRRELYIIILLQFGLYIYLIVICSI